MRIVREIGLRGHVAVALVPARERVAGQHVHLAVDGEEVVAHVQRLGAGAHVFAPVRAGHALADEPSLQVGKRHQHRVDPRLGDGFVEHRRLSSIPRTVIRPAYLLGRDAFTPE